MTWDATPLFITAVSGELEEQEHKFWFSLKAEWSQNVVTFLKIAHLT